MSEQVTPSGPGAGSRRTLLVGAAAVGASVVLAACGDDDGSDSGDRPNGTTAPAPTTPGESAPDGTPGGAPVVLAKVSEVPVGSGKIIAGQGVVVTQPTDGVFKGFSAVCTHQACPLANVDAGLINCTCHGSKFSIEDGVPKNGPATRPLPTRDVRVDGENIVLA